MRSQARNQATIATILTVLCACSTSPGSSAGGGSSATGGGGVVRGSGGGGAPQQGSTGGTGTGGNTVSGGAGNGVGGATASGGSTGQGGTGGVDAGSSAGGTGPFGYGGPSRCATAGVAFCDSFEGGLDATTWTTTRSGDATIAVEAGRAARGTRALHVRTATGNGFAYITERTSFPPTNNTLYGRMFVYFSDALTSGGHFSLAEAGGTGNNAVIRFGGQFNEFGVGTDGGASGDWTDKDTKLIPAQTWICTEFEFKGDTNEFHVWSDDVEIAPLRTGVARHAGFAMPQFNRLWFGWWMYNAVETQELWIDEVAVDYKPIGCTK